MTAPGFEYTAFVGRTRATADARHRGSRRAETARRLGVPWLLLAVVACSEQTPTPAENPPDQTQAAETGPSIAELRPTGNQLRNPGFEDGIEGWGEMGTVRWVGFEVVDEPVHSGSKAARMFISWHPNDREQPISARGAIQEISPARFPDRLSGWYRVDHWENSSDQTLLYLDVAVVAMGDPRTLEIVDPEDPDLHPNLSNYQVRYYMAGLDEPYENLLNMRAKLVGAGPPKLGEWVHFDFPIKADFQELWGAVPADFQFLRVFFETRWEEKEEGAPLRADIYYDDLFFGFDEPPGP